MKKTYILLFFFFAPYLSYSEPLQSRSGFGPLHFTTQSFFQLLHGSYLHDGSELPKAGEFRVLSTATWANTWDYNRSRYRFDFESWLFTESVAYSVTDHLQVSLRFQFLRVGGGVLDQHIENFHKNLGISNGGRDEFRQNDFAVEALDLETNQTVIIFSADKDTGWTTPAPAFSIRYALHSNTSKLPITLQFSTSFHRPDNSLTVINEDLQYNAIGLSTAFRYNTRMASTFSISYMRTNGSNDLGLSRWLLSTMFSFDYQFSEKSAFITQILRESSVGKSTDTSFDKATTEILFGTKQKWFESFTFEFAIVENLFIHDNSVDFAFFAGVEAHF